MVQVAVIVVLTVWPAWAHHGGAPYEGLFKQAITQYWSSTPHDWRLLSALAAAESSYRPDVVSYAGAIGLLQVLPSTYREIRQQGVPIGDNPKDPRDNVRAGSYYLRRLYRIFTDERRSEDDRLRVALASYNAGVGNLLKAQKRAVAKGKIGVSFNELATELPLVTGSHAAGTVKYSNKIVRNYREAQAAAIPREVLSIPPVAVAPIPVEQAPIPAPPATVRVVVQQESSTDWSQLVGLLYLVFNGRGKENEEPT